MPKPRCTKKGGTLKQACQAIFRCVLENPGHKNEWYVYSCECGKFHITNNPK